MTCKKMPWMRKFLAECAHEERLLEMARKGKTPLELLPKDKGGKHKPAKLLLFKELQEQVKLENLRKQKKERNNA